MIHTVLLSSGGIRVISHVGALCALDAAGLLTHVKRWCGVSGGALLATCFALGYSMAEARDICERFDFSLLQELCEDGPLQFLETFSIDAGYKLQRFLEALFHVRGFSDKISFADLSRSGAPALRIWATNLDAGRLETFDSEQTPDISILMALRASMSIPLYYPPVEHPVSGQYYIDGAVFHPCPVYMIPVDEQAGLLAVWVFTHIKEEIARTPEAYVIRVLRLFYESRNKDNVSLFKDMVLPIHTDAANEIDFGLSADQKRELFAAGQEAAATFIAARAKSSIPKRRASI